MLHTIFFIVVGLAILWVWVDSLFIHPRFGEFNKTSKIVWSVVALLFLVIIGGLFWFVSHTG